ncbi:MAG: hypothetical protein QW304_01120 [Thermoproteota archaeon]
MINSRGQMRVVEALLASGIIAVAMMTMISLTRTPNPYSAKYRNELTKYCYDLLMSLGEQEVFDKVMFGSGGLKSREEWEGSMKNMLNALISPTVVYNMTVYNMTQNPQNRMIVEHTPLGTVSNASPEDFRVASEATGADVVYTTRRRWVLKIHLELARR